MFHTRGLVFTHLRSASSILGVACVFALLAPPGAGVAFAQEPGEDAPAAGSDAPSGGESERAQPAVQSLSDRIKSVQRKLHTKKQRVELAPFMAYQVNDAFRDNFLGGAQVTYNFTDGLGLGLRLAGSMIATDTDSLKSVRAESEVNPLIADVRWIAGLDFAWSPIYGKVSFLAEKIVHFDAGISGGLGMVGLAKSGGLVPKASAEKDSGLSADVGLVGRVFLTEYLTVWLDFRDYMYVVSYDEKFIAESRGDGASVSDFKNSLLFSVGAGFFFPMHPKGMEDL